MSKNQAKSSRPTVLSFASVTFSPHLPCMSIVKCQWENIAGAKRYSRPRGFNIVGASTPVAPSIPTPLCQLIT